MDLNLQCKGACYEYMNNRTIEWIFLVWFQIVNCVTFITFIYINSSHMYHLLNIYNIIYNYLLIN